MFERGEQWINLKTEDLKSLDIKSSELDYTSIIMFNCLNIECREVFGIKYKYSCNIFPGNLLKCNYDILFPKKVRDGIVKQIGMLLCNSIIKMLYFIM